MASWAVASAEKQLNEVIHEAEVAGPQTLSKSGKEVAVVISIEEWKRLSGQITPEPEKEESMADFFLRSPLRGSGIVIERVKFRPRKLDL